MPSPQLTQRAVSSLPPAGQFDAFHDDLVVGAGGCLVGLAPPTLSAPPAGSITQSGRNPPPRAGTPVTGRVFGLLLTALAVQMAFKGRRHECDSSGYGLLTTRALGSGARIIGFTNSGR
jgi:hypothetical protein